MTEDDREAEVCIGLYIDPETRALTVLRQLDHLIRAMDDDAEAEDNASHAGRALFAANKLEQARNHYVSYIVRSDRFEYDHVGELPEPDYTRYHDREEGDDG